MKCSQCSHENQPDFSFCEECGAPVAQVTCPDCGHANQPDFNFCEECASPLHAAATAATSPQSAAQPADPSASPTPAAAALSPEPELPAPAQPRPSSIGAACPHCGFANPAGLRFCGSCGQSLLKKAARPKKKLGQRILRVVFSVLSSLLITVVSALGTRYAVPFVMDLVDNVQTTGISQQEAIRQADNFVRLEYDDYLGVQPQVQKALDGQREVYAVAYSHGGSTLVVVVDAVTGAARLLPPDR